MKALRIFLIMALGIVLAMGVVGCGSDNGGDSSSGGSSGSICDNTHGNTYQVWGGETAISGLNGYEPENSGYTLLGSNTTSGTFDGTYTYYIIRTAIDSIAKVDSLKGSNGRYYGAPYTGNVLNPQNIMGETDGKYASVGEDYRGCSVVGFIGIETNKTITSITVTVIK